MKMRKNSSVSKSSSTKRKEVDALQSTEISQQIEPHSASDADIEGIEASEEMADEREAYLEERESYVASQFLTIQDFKRHWRVQTLKKAKEFESPEAKIRRFIDALAFGLAAQFDAPYGWDWPKRKCVQHTLAIQHLMRKCTPQKQAIFDDLINGTPGVYFERMLSLQGEVMDQIYVPRAWLPALTAEWKLWLKADTAKKREREIRGRGRSEAGRLLKTRQEGSSQFSKAHPNIFKKKSSK